MELKVEKHTPAKPEGWHSLEYSSYKPKRHSILEHDSRNSLPKGLVLIKVFPQFLVPEPD